MKWLMLIIWLFMTPNLTFAAQKLNFGKAPIHYSREMEFFYQQPRLEIIPQLLKSFSENHYLDYSENRLVTAAFLAQLIKLKKLDCEKFVKDSLKLNNNGRATVAWAVHLGQCPTEKTLLESLLTLQDVILARQIANTRAPLTQWSQEQENTVILMFLAAFMASGDVSWLNEIIDTALNRRHKLANFAAAVLYDFAPRHPLMVRELQKRLAEADAGQKKIIETILQNSD